MWSLRFVQRLLRSAESFLSYRDLCRANAISMAEVALPFILSLPSLTLSAVLLCWLAPCPDHFLDILMGIACA
jgi:hypothetical protein